MKKKVCEYHPKRKATLICEECGAYYCNMCGEDCDFICDCVRVETIVKIE